MSPKTNLELETQFIIRPYFAQKLGYSTNIGYFDFIFVQKKKIIITFFECAFAKSCLFSDNTSFVIVIKLDF